jgi:hypothetical protein
MYKRLVLLGLAMAGLAMGIYFAGSGDDSGPATRKPAINTIDSRPIKDDNIVLERKYLRCGHTIISAYDGGKDLRGKTLSEIKTLFKYQDGYTVSFDNDRLIIRETVDEWCPRDKERCRLKEYKGMLAVYQGPEPENDTLLRVTSIKMSALPAAVQTGVREGKYEFETEEALNDALENLDEYL